MVAVYSLVIFLITGAILENLDKIINYINSKEGD